MIIFYKFMVISACSLLALLIRITDRTASSERTEQKFIWFLLDLYALGLVFTAIKVLVGG